MGKADVINSGVQENKRFVAFSEEQVEAALDLFIAQTIDDEGGSTEFNPFDHEKVDPVLVETFLFHTSC